MSEETTPKREEEVDLAQLFKIIGNAIRSLFVFIYSILYNIYAFIILCLLFLKSNILYLIIAVGIGYGISHIKDSSSTLATYEGTAILQPNFQLEFQLQSRIEDFNQLISVADTLKLSQELKIPLDKASTLQGFEIEPIFSVNKLRFDYYNYIYEQKDTTLYKKFTFDMYREDLRFEDYTDYEIKVFSTDKNAIGLLGNTLWNFEDSENLQNRKLRELEVFQNQKMLLERTLKSIDSTRTTQRQVMLKEAERTNNASNTSIDLGSRQTYKEEPKIYEYENILREELVTTITNIESRKNLVNVLKSFPESGKIASGTDRQYYMLFALFLAIFILLAIKLWKHLASFESEGGVKFKKIG